MPVGLIVIGGVIIVGIAFRIIFPTEAQKLGITFRGGMNKLIYDKAKTPEGAEAIYTEAIEVATKKYNDADDAVRVLSGRIKLAEKDLVNLQKELQQTETRCANLVKSGNYEDAELFAEKREDILMSIENKKSFIADTQPLYDDAKVILEESQKALRTLEKRKVQVVEQLKNSIEFNQMVDSVDQLKSTGPIDRLLSSVDEGYRESQEKLAGARESYNNRLETKMHRATQRAKASTSSAYVEELKKKYNK